MLLSSSGVFFLLTTAVKMFHKPLANLLHFLFSVGVVCAQTDGRIPLINCAHRHDIFSVVQRDLGLFILLIYLLTACCVEFKLIMVRANALQLGNEPCY